MPVAPPVVVPFRARSARPREIIARLSGIAPADAAFDWDDRWATAFRDAADALGPVFSSFAAYLGSRVDLGSIADCRVLGREPAARRRWPVDRVQRLITADLGPRAPVVEMGTPPLALSPSSQTHRAYLPTGERVEVEVITLDADAAAADLDLLHLTWHACGNRFSAGVFAAVLADFRTGFQRQRDCRRRLPLATAIAGQIREDAPVAVPVVHADLCTSRVYVTELFEARAGGPAGEDKGLPDAKLRAVSWWFRRALAGMVIPLSVGGAVDRDGRLIMRGPFAQLPAESASHLTAYLVAVIGESPDRAWASLAHELVATPGASPGEEVARAFRCLVPFRDDRTCDSGSDAADHMFLQWRRATSHGWVPAPHLIPFYQGGFRIVATARAQGETGDPLADALGGLRAEAGLRQFEEWSRALDVMGAMEQQLTLLLQLPQKIDQLLTIAADGTVRVQLVSGDSAGAARRSRLATAIAVLLVTSAALALVATALSMPPVWSDAGQAVLLLVAGGLLVWAVGRVL